MFLTILGVILLFFPLTLVSCFKNRLYGFALILSIILSGHLVIGLITQSLNIFYYPIILSFHLLVALISLRILIKRKQILFTKLSWAPFVLLAFLIIFVELYSVHHYYSGEIATISKTIKVEQAHFPYPYFSDEWVGVALINHSLENNTLPNGNPLAPGRYYHDFSNILIAFFSLTAELMLLLQVTPLNAYVFFALAAGFLICYLVYLLLRANKLTKLAAIFGALSIPLITNSSNLPGLWYYLPFIGGLIAFLLSLIAATLKKFPLYFLTCLLSLLLYPPLIVFIFVSLLAVSFLRERQELKQKLKIFFGGLLSISSAAAIIIIWQKNHLATLWPLIKKSLFSPSLDNGIVNYSPENVLPIIILLLSLLGLASFLKLKKYFLLFPTILGLIFWTVYSYTFNFFIISAERVVVTTAILLTITAAFGFNFLLNKIPSKFLKLDHDKWLLILKISLILIFGLAALTYTNRDLWKKLKLQVVYQNSKQIISPLPPTTQYLTNDDLKIFQTITQEKFLSIPWKGLVIGAATNNYPLESKPSFISNRFLLYRDFIRSDCNSKNILANRHKFIYFYSFPFSCPLFQEISVSSENLRLYKFVP